VISQASELAVDLDLGPVTLGSVSHARGANQNMPLASNAQTALTLNCSSGEG
jgi:hypothetical protein